MRLRRNRDDGNVGRFSRQQLVEAAQERSVAERREGFRGRIRVHDCDELSPIRLGDDARVVTAHLTGAD